MLWAPPPNVSMLDPIKPLNAAQNKPDQIIKTMAENSSIFIKEILCPDYCTLKPKNTNPQTKRGTKLKEKEEEKKKPRGIEREERRSTGYRGENRE